MASTSADADSDLALALQLELEWEQERQNLLPNSTQKPSSEPTSLVAPEWEDLDPTPDLHAMFLQFNDRFFWSKLSGCEVKWSPRMTLCAGVCSYHKRSGYCSIRLSVPLLKLRPRSDFVETLLHEMIHAYLFVTDGNDDHDGHGPAFHSHMYRINKEAGTKISVYHNFHDEVASYQNHWWKCDGPCRHRRPFFGLVKRSMNRKPGPYDRWWAEHQATCGGTFVKIKEPEGYGDKKKRKRDEIRAPEKGQRDIRAFTQPGSEQRSEKGNIFGFGGTSFASPSSSVGVVATKGRSGTVAVKGSSRIKDNSSSGHVIQRGEGEGSQALSAQVTSSESEGAREKVRDIWSKKYPSTSSSASSSQQGVGVKKRRLATCPVCSTGVDEAVINQHLDECLTREALKEEAATPIPDDNTVLCKICRREVYKGELGYHQSFCQK